MKPISIVYLLADTPLFGGVTVILQQANALVRRGYRVQVASPGPPPAWFALEAEFIQTTGLSATEIPPADVTVATYWTTILPAHEGAAHAVVHYCQGFEASYTHNHADHPAILDAYRRPLPAIVVAPHLGDLLLHRFGRPSRVVPNALDPGFLRAGASGFRLGPRRRPRILVTSPFEIDWKGVSTALEAVRILRASGLDCELVRLSQWPLTDAERALVAADEFHCHLPPAQVPTLVRGCDLLLAASWEQEGFGLPVLEAMACGVPVVASDVACYRGFAAPAARLVPADDPRAFAAAAREILADRRRWRRMRAAGRRVAWAFRRGPATTRAEETLHWVASDAWRTELRSIERDDGPGAAADGVQNKSTSPQV